MSTQPHAGTITAVVAQPRVRRHLGARINIFVDDKFSFALDRDLVLQHGLRPGLALSPDELENLLQQDGDARAYARALNFLSYRPRSSKEIRDKLVRDEFPDSVVHRVLERLQKEGQVNDANFASLWVESRTHSRPKGARVLRQELRIKGVEAETIAHSLPDDEQERLNALEAVRPQMRKWNGLDERAQRDKAIAFLQRRGFGFGAALSALRALAEEDQDTDDNEPRA
jgi:regulatory protein